MRERFKMQFDGELNNVSLPNLLQLIKSGALTGKLTISDQSKHALICFEKGQIVNAEDDKHSGRDALLLLFLWSEGKFSFLEDSLDGVPRSFDPNNSSDGIETLLKEGISYAAQRKFLNERGIKDTTVLKRKGNLGEIAQADAGALLDFLDGRTNLLKALQSTKLTEPASTEAVYILVEQGMVDVLAEIVTNKTETISLPDWVTARLKQDNRDLSQAIVDMVIWVDRVKCWMYQADADLDAVLKNMADCQKQPDSNQSTLDN